MNGVCQHRNSEKECIWYFNWFGEWVQCNDINPCPGQNIGDKKMENNQPIITRCKGCGAPIFFIKYNNKNIPLNATPRKVFIANEDEFGNIDFWELVNGYETHFSSCPKADEFRRNKNGETGINK